MLTRHTIEHKRANNPYRCTIDGCLDSYAEKRKLISHLNYKHTELSKKEREVMIMKGDELLKKLRNISLNESSMYYSKLLPIISPTIDITQQTIIPIHFPSLNEAETISISVTTTTTSATNNDQSLSTDNDNDNDNDNDIISTNHILKNIFDNGKGNEMLLKRSKSGMVHFDNVNNTPCISNSTALKYSQADMTHSLSIHNNLIKTERDKKLDVTTVTTPSTIILKKNSCNRSLTVRELLGLNVTKKRKIKCTNESLPAAKYFVKSKFLK
ncbi:unnamed protein product [Brugia pahangi]|uniref:C2H2-type domain-containing protein n=1 Tax=Brugia pahangi TaxID=6280 RepID=A0A0N4T4P6_BRUPA|nr:unnamed protein product [Brugia pahangi]